MSSNWPAGDQPPQQPPGGQPPAGPGGGYGPPAYGTPYPGGSAFGAPGAGAPPNYLVWAILTTLFCFLPFGIVSIVYAAQVNGKYTSGDYQGAANSSRRARTWAIAAAVTGVVLIGLYLALGVAASSHSSTRSTP